MKRIIKILFVEYILIVFLGPIRATGEVMRRSSSTISGVGRVVSVLISLHNVRSSSPVHCWLCIIVRLYL